MSYDWSQWREISAARKRKIVKSARVNGKTIEVRFSHYTHRPVRGPDNAKAVYIWRPFFPRRAS
jgi:hypothetical protein